jgi:hypothetical protein
LNKTYSFHQLLWSLQVEQQATQIFESSNKCSTARVQYVIKEHMVKY